VSVFYTHPLIYIIDLIATVGGVVVGVGEGGTIGHGKYYAAIQALQYFVTHPPVSILQTQGILPL
jgi:hypothetical protein